MATSTLLKKIGTWFTPKRRRAIYVGVTAIGTCLVAIGVITPDAISNMTDSLSNISGLILALTGVLAVINVNPSDGDVG